MAATPKRGLGKGLGALIPTESAPTAPTALPAPSPAATQTPPADSAGDIGATYAELPIDSITPNPRQPRSVFDDDALAELVFSIKEIGLLQPIVVRPLSPDAYELVAGERRLRASKVAGLTVIPAIIRQTEDDAMLRDALLENLHRANLNPLEEAAAYQQLLSDFGCTQDELAQRVGRSRPQVSNTLRLLKLPPDVQRRVAAGVLSAGHARALLTLDDPAEMDALASRIVKEGLSVRAVEEIVILGNPGKKRSTRTRGRTSANSTLTDAVTELAGRAAESLETRATTSGFGTRSARGKLIVECADVADLRRIVELLEGPGSH